MACNLLVVRLVAFCVDSKRHPGAFLMRKIALISEHASPLAATGGVDSGGQNIYVANVARLKLWQGGKP